MGQTLTDESPGSSVKAGDSGLQVVDHLHPAFCGVELSLFLDQSGVVYRKAVEKVHEDHNHQEDEDEEEDVAEAGVDLEGYFGELKLTDKHGEGLDQREAKMVKELLLSTLDVGMEKDVETKAKGDNEEGVPEEEGEEGGEDPEKHG